MISKNWTSIFIVPRGSNEWKGNEAGWITASGWAAAGKQLFGSAVVTTTDGIFQPEESRLFPRQGSEKISEKRGGTYGKSLLRKIIPVVLITAIKDWKLKRSKPQVWPIENYRLPENEKVTMVWERHDLFPGPGRKIADKFKVPLVTSVEALTVWEAEKWGVKRPFWGNYLEKFYEADSLKKSDLVCCVSEEVKEKVISMGVPEEKVIVTPNRVDTSIFHPGIDGSSIEKIYKLKDKTVIGWTGSFRSFHALDDIVNAFKEVHSQRTDTVLMLIGDGQEFDKIEEMVNNLGLNESVIMTGRQSFNEIPIFVKNFDICLVSARSSEGFHYSPLKLREYKAVGKAVVAPEAGDLPSIFEDEKDLLFYEAGNFKSLSDKILMLLNNPGLKGLLEDNSRQWVEKEGAWIHELQKVCKILGIKSTLSGKGADI